MNVFMDKVYIAALTLGAVLLVLFGAYRAGGKAVRKSVELRRARRLDQQRDLVREAIGEVDTMDDAALYDDAQRWVRGHSGR